MTNYCLGDILKLVTNCNREYISNKLEDRQRSKLEKTLNKLSFGNISSDYLSIMSKCYLSYEFFHKLIDELTVKNIYQIKLMKDIRVIINGIVKSEKNENPHTPLIYEETILELLNDKIGIHDNTEESVPSEISKDKLTATGPATVNNIETLNKTDEEKVSGITDKIKALFSFVNFLHANIDNFNQYNNDILELIKMQKRFSRLGTHFTEVREKRVLENELSAKWNVILENITTPLKNKVAELDLFDWYAPETFLNNCFHAAAELSKNYDDKDLVTILKAKTQYIEFTNKISSNVIRQDRTLFENLQEVMVEIATNFWEEGDKAIKKIEVKQVETFEELVESFKAGEIASLPLHINNSDTESTQSNLNVPYSKTENNAEYIEQPNQNKLEEDTMPHTLDVDNDTIVKTKSKGRTINKDKLSDYFKPQFKGMGRSENDFDKLIAELEAITEDYEKKRIGKKIAQIALLIHNSDKLNARKPEHFVEWHTIFCDCIAIPYTKYYPFGLKPIPQNLIDLFNYLE